jgi:DNA-binding transcriptional MocR family regulator
MWTPHKLSPRGPVYLAIADALAADLEAGRVRPGDRLPTHRSLARTLGVNVVTVTRAYAEAARRGLVEGQVGRGTFVRALERRPSATARAPAASGAIDLSQNQIALDPAWLDPAEVLEALAEEASATFFSGYQPAGPREHRAAGAQWLARAGLALPEERVLVTAGGQQALAVALASFTRPGDALLVEELTYAGMKSLAALFHLRLLPVALDDQGVVPEALEDACRRGNPRLFYCMPNLHNPTGVVLPPERRERIAELAERYDLLVLEDDASGFLLDAPPPPIAAFVPERGLFVSSLSKSFTPALRVGYLAAPAACVERLLQSQSALTWMTAPLTGAIASSVIRDGRLERIVAAKRAEVHRRRLLWEQSLGTLASPSHPASSCVWALLPEPWRGEEFAAEAEHQGVLLSAAEAFVVGRAHTPHAVRVCLGQPAARRQVGQAFERLAGILARGPSPLRALV